MENQEIYYVYLEGICGTELIAAADNLELAEKYKAEKLAERKPGYMWDVVIDTNRRKEVNCWD